MRITKNEDIRKAIKDNGVYYWQIAEQLGINDGNFSRKLRKELSQEEKQEIFSIINELKAGADNE